VAEREQAYGWPHNPLNRQGRQVERKVTWFDSPEEVEEADRRHYANMTPHERMDEMVSLLNRWGKWNE